MYSKSVIAHDRDSVTLSSGQKINNVHASGFCAGEYCPIHKASDHDFNDLPLSFNGISMLRKREDGSLFPDPDDYAFNQGQLVIVENSAKCLTCGEKLQSESHYDFASCSCGNVFVDGGLNYIRHGMKDKNKYENTSVSYQMKK